MKHTEVLLNYKVTTLVVMGQLIKCWTHTHTHKMLTLHYKDVFKVKNEIFLTACAACFEYLTHVYQHACITAFLSISVHTEINRCMKGGVYVHLPNVLCVCVSNSSCFMLSSQMLLAGGDLFPLTDGLVLP